MSVYVYYNINQLANQILVGTRIKTKRKKQGKNEKEKKIYIYKLLKFFFDKKDNIIFSLSCLNMHLMNKQILV